MLEPLFKLAVADDVPAVRESRLRLVSTLM